MDSFEVSIFSLSLEEKKECKEMNIPNYYWYYLKSKKFGFGIKTLRNFVKSRIKPIFSKQELEVLIRGIVGKIRELVIHYNDGKKQGIEYLEKEFNSEIFFLVKNILDKRERSKKRGIKKGEVKKIFTIISRDGDKQILNPASVPSGKIVKDRCCLYFPQCSDFIASHVYKGRFDCSFCKHNINKEE
ncbi:hypothetical protein KAU09_03465 [Candidatus Parcubacteria bacterium]|nr:hypothetical protein [Candidatus Parcubacteria bacterium]